MQRNLVIVWHKNAINQKKSFFKDYKTTSLLPFIKNDAARHFGIDPKKYEMVLYSSKHDGGFDPSSVECAGELGQYTRVSEMMPNKPKAAFFLRKVVYLPPALMAIRDAEKDVEIEDQDALMVDWEEVLENMNRNAQKPIMSKPKSAPKPIPKPVPKTVSDAEIADIIQKSKAILEKVTYYGVQPEEDEEEGSTDPEDDLFMPVHSAKEQERRRQKEIR